MIGLHRWIELIKYTMLCYDLFYRGKGRQPDYPGWVSIAVGNTITKSYLGRKGLFQLIAVVHHKGKSERQELRERHKMLLTGPFLMAYLTCFLIWFRTTCPGWHHPPHINHQPKCCPTDLPRVQCDVAVFSIEVSSFSFYQVDIKTSQHTDIKRW